MITRNVGRVCRVLIRAYPIALFVLVLLFRHVGERWWPLTVALYLPRAVFGLPLVVAVLLAWRWRRSAPRLWIPIVLAALIVLGPLMGLELSLPRRVHEERSIRVMTWNMWFGRRGVSAILDEIDADHPDVVALQAGSRELVSAFRTHFAGWQLSESGEFLLISRYPISETWKPPHLDDVDGSPASFRRFTIATPLGAIDLLSTHPYSARDGISGLRHLDRGARAWFAENAELRRQQMAAVVEEAHKSVNKVVIVGDTNLPGQSQILGSLLGDGRYRDAFVEAGRGFGYTFPADRHPWMRIDRVFTGAGLRATRVEVGGRNGSDHCPVIATIEADAQ